MCAMCLCADRFGLGWAHDAFYFACHMFMHFPCIHTFFSTYCCCLGLFLLFFSSSSDPSPSNIRFCDDDAFKAFSENFSRRGIHSEIQVILSDFADTDLPSVIHNRRWESLCDVPVTCPLVLIQEFYSNMHGIDHLIPLFFTRIRGTRIPVTPQLVADVLHVPRIEFPDYPSCERLRTMSRDELMSSFCERPTA